MTVQELCRCGCEADVCKRLSCLTPPEKQIANKIRNSTCVNVSDMHSTTRGQEGDDETNSL